MHRKAVPLDDGWSVIQPRRHQKTQNHAKSCRNPDVERNDDAFEALRMKERVDHEVVIKLRDKIEQYLTQWRDDPTRAKFVSALKAEDKSWDNEHLTITNACCIGLGTFDANASGGTAAATKCLRQAAFFLDIVDLLQTRRQQPAPLPQAAASGRSEKDGYGSTLAARDPKFTPTDMAVLSAFNIAVEPPDTNYAITIKSLLFAPFVPWPALLGSVLAAPTTPALYIGTPIGDAAAAIERCRTDPAEPVESGNVIERHIEGRVVSVEQLVQMWGVVERVRREMQCVWVFGADVGFLRGCEVWVRLDKESGDGDDG